MNEKMLTRTSTEAPFCVLEQETFSPLYWLIPRKRRLHHECKNVDLDIKPQRNDLNMYFSAVFVTLASTFISSPEPRALR